MIGQTLSHYKILEQLGQGGMGVVYKAQDIRLLRHVAVKILAAELMGDEKRRQRFIKEAQTASSLNHPNICTIHDIDEAESAHFIVMEFIEGETLRGRLNRRGPLPEAEVIDLTLKVCEALAAVHEKGIFHRDVKPDNIMISRQGFLKVTDFGLAKLATEAAETVAEIAFEQNIQFGIGAPKNTYVESVVLTNLSGLLGTVHYMSPEQAQGKTIDHRSDIFSLGVMLYELLIGKRPFEGESNLTILSKIINAPPAPMELDPMHVSPELQQLIYHSVAKEPAQRFQHVNEIIADLRLLAQAKPSVPEKKRVAKTSTINPEAYENYLKGSFCFDNFTPMNLHKSIEAFKHAIKNDPNFVEAHVGLGRALTHLGMTNWGPPAEAFAEARTVVMAALALEPENAEAMAILALIKFQTEYDWTGAAKLFKQAMARNPESVIVNDSYAFYLTFTTQLHEAIRCARHCLSKVPQPCYYQLRLGWTYFVARLYDEAIAQLRETQRHFPELAFADSLLGWCYSLKGMHAHALSECAKGESKGIPPWQASWIYARAGKIEEAKARLDAFRKQNLPNDLSQAFAYAALGEFDLAFEELEKAYEKRLSLLVCLKAFPQYDVLRSDPRYFALLKKIGLENDQLKASQIRTINPDAYESYLKGSFCFDNFTPMNLNKGIEFFRRAVKDIPNFVEAYVGLARALTHMGMTNWGPAAEAFAEARTVVMHALELEPENAEAMAILALLKFQTEYDWTGAAELFQQAMALNPESVIVNDSYAFYFTNTTQHHDAIRCARHCLEKVPQPCYYQVRLGWTYFVARQYDEAIAQLRETQLSFPELAFADILLSWGYAMTGMPAQALAECAKAESKGVPSWQASWLYALAGKTEEAKARLDVFRKQNLPDDWGLLFTAYAALGEIDLAFEELEKAYERRLSNLVYLKAFPHFDVLRSDPRYFALLKKIGLEE